MRTTVVDAGRRGWVVRVGASLAAPLAPDLNPAGSTVVGIDMPLGLVQTGWRAADRAARGLLGLRRSSVFAIPPRAVWGRPVTGPRTCSAVS